MEYNAFDLTAKLNYKPRLLARIKWWFRRHKFIKERAKQGWSNYDIWDFDTYLAMVIGGATERLAKSHMSHPWNYTPEEWSEKLLTISECFKQYLVDEPCPAYEAYCKATERVKNEDGSITFSAPDELLQAWREEERAKLRKENEETQRRF